VPGGGTSLLRAAEATAAASASLDKDEQAGALVLQIAAEQPLRQLAANAGLEPGVVVERVRHLPVGHGFDVERREFGDLAKSGIFEPTAVVRAALGNAAFYARRVLGTEALIVQPEYAGRLRETAAQGGPANLSMP
jgi:chaperonin GroEL